MRALQGRSTYREEVLITCLDGTRRPVFIDASPLLSIRGKIVGALLVLHDATEQRKIREDFEDRITRLISDRIELENSSRGSPRRTF